MVCRKEEGENPSSEDASRETPEQNENGRSSD